MKDVGNPEFKISPTSKRNMGSSSERWDQSYCRVPSQQTECDSRLEQSRNTSTSSEWKLDPQSFQKICQLRGTLETDLFASNYLSRSRLNFR